MCALTRHRARRGSAILYILFLVLSVSIIVILAAEIGMQTWRGENRYEDQINAQRAWEGVCAQIDADTQGSGITIPATYSVNQNGVTGTVTVSDNSSSISNSNIATATLTVTADSRTYPESTVIPKKAHTPSVWDYLFYGYGAHDLSGGQPFTATGDIDINGKIAPGGGTSTLTGNALATGTINNALTVSGTKTQNGTMPFSAPSVSAANYAAAATTTYATGLTTNGWAFSTSASGASYDLVYVTGDLHIQGTISGKGTFYITGNFVLDNDVALAPGAEVAFIIPNKPVTINHTCNGLFYCNNGNTQIKVNFTGAIVANQVTNAVNGDVITFDSTIKNDSNTGVLMHLPGLWP